MRVKSNVDSKKKKRYIKRSINLKLDFLFSFEYIFFFFDTAKQFVPEIYFPLIFPINHQVIGQSCKGSLKHWPMFFSQILIKGGKEWSVQKVIIRGGHKVDLVSFH